MKLFELLLPSWLNNGGQSLNLIEMSYSGNWN